MKESLSIDNLLFYCFYGRKNENDRILSKEKNIQRRLSFFTKKNVSIEELHEGFSEPHGTI